MHVVIVGSGPVGTVAALLLARRGDRVTLVDRDPGPRSGSWERKGVMQFHQPHGYRAGFREVLLHHLPDVYQTLLEAGTVVDQPDDRNRRAGMAVRRPILERTLWTIADREPGVTRVTGNVDAVRIDGGRVVGAGIGGWTLAADLVIDAAGRGSRFGAELRPAPDRCETGMAYASRLYQFHRDADRGPLGNGVLIFGALGYAVLIFAADAGTFTVLLVRAAHDRELAQVRDPRAFDAALQLLPAVREITDPLRSRPIGPVRAGSGLVNQYRPQAAVPGMLAIGDSVLTTNPMGARGMTLGLQSAVAMVQTVQGLRDDQWSSAMHEWSERQLRPWYADHVEWDAALAAAWSGADPDPAGPLSLDLLVAAGIARPELMAGLAPYLDMRALPESTSTVRAEVRDMLRAGWRPPAPDLPTRADLVRAIAVTDSAAAVA
jgi:2-polyprenyl-6-methoxyphenol hydroxylase-like FAD-dependent oxidoreductase